MKGVCEWKKKLAGIFSGSFLFAVNHRILCVSGDRGREVLLALTQDGQVAWQYEYLSGQHNVFFTFQDRAYLDGDRIVALTVDSGKVAGERAFEVPLTAQAPSSLGPVYWRGRLVSATAVLGLDSQTLETVWEWPDPSAITRGRWLFQRSKADGSFEFARLPDLLRVTVPSHVLPSSGTGRQVMCVDKQDWWCAFGDDTRVAISLPDGRVTWQHQENDKGDHRILASTQESAYAGVSSLSAYSLSDGRLRWRREAPNQLDTRAAVSGDTGDFVTAKRIVHRVDLATGDFNASFGAPADIMGIAAVDDFTVVIGTLKLLLCIKFQ